MDFLVEQIKLVIKFFLFGLNFFFFFLLDSPFQIVALHIRTDVRLILHQLLFVGFQVFAAGRLLFRKFCYFIFKTFICKLREKHLFFLSQKFNTLALCWLVCFLTACSRLCLLRCCLGALCWLDASDFYSAREVSSWFSYLFRLVDHTSCRVVVVVRLKR